MRPIRKLCKLDLLVVTLVPFARDDELEEAAHVFRWDEFVAGAAEHEDGGRARDERDLGRRVPFLVAQERERGEERERGGDESGEVRERVLEDEGCDLQEEKVWI